jgi:hypothetical protein
VIIAVNVVVIFRCLECVFNPNLALMPTVTDPPQKWGDNRLKINKWILNEVRMNKHTYEAYKDMIKVEIKLLQLCLEITR